MGRGRGGGRGAKKREEVGGREERREGACKVGRYERQLKLAINTVSHAVPKFSSAPTKLMYAVPSFRLCGLVLFVPSFITLKRQLSLRRLLSSGVSACRFGH